MNKTALVTGMETNIIAQHVCVNFLEAGYEVVATADPGYDTNKVEAELQAIEKPRLSFEIGSFYSSEGMSELVKRLSGRTYDVVVNCAAALASKPDGSLRNESIDFDYGEFNRVLQYNVTAMAAICLGLKDQIRPGGLIVNVSSSAAEEGAFATISYNASKAAINSLTKSLANVLGPSRGIRVNGIAPGWIPPGGDAAAEGVVALANALTPSLVTGKPGDVVNALNYLISAPFQNGSVLAVDGGIGSSYLSYMLESLQLQGTSVDDAIDSLVSLLSRAKREMRSDELDRGL